MGSVKWTVHNCTLEVWTSEILKCNAKYVSKNIKIKYHEQPPHHYHHHFTSTLRCSAGMIMTCKCLVSQKFVKRRFYYISPLSQFSEVSVSLLTLSDRSPLVGVLSWGSDSGMGSLSSLRWMPGQPTQIPLQRTTTGATAVTRPPALQQRVQL